MITLELDRERRLSPEERRVAAVTLLWLADIIREERAMFEEAAIRRGAALVGDHVGQVHPDYVPTGPGDNFKPYKPTDLWDDDDIARYIRDAG